MKNLGSSSNFSGLTVLALALILSLPLVAQAADGKDQDSTDNSGENTTELAENSADRVE